LENVRTKLADRCVFIVVGGGMYIYIYKSAGLATVGLYSNNMFVLRSSSFAFGVRVEWTDNLALGHTPSALLNCITFPPRFFIFIILAIFFLQFTPSRPLLSPRRFHLHHGRSRLHGGYGTHAYRKNAKYYITVPASRKKIRQEISWYPTRWKRVSNPKRCLARTRYVYNTRRSVDNNSRKHHGFPKWDLCGKKTVWPRHVLFLNIFA